VIMVNHSDGTPRHSKTLGRLLGCSGKKREYPAQLRSQSSAAVTQNLHYFKKVDVAMHNPPSVLNMDES
jgi:hypothetical protein